MPFTDTEIFERQIVFGKPSFLLLVQSHLGFSCSGDYFILGHTGRKFFWTNNNAGSIGGARERGCFSCEGGSNGHLRSWRKTLQGFRFSERLVDVSPVLYFLLVGEEIQSAFSTAIDPFSLMFHVVLHVYMTTPKDFETEGTEQVFCVFMDTSEMCLHFREERRPEVADLAHVGHFPGLVGVFHVLQEKLLRLERQLTYLTIGGGFDRAVSALDVALQLEGSHVLSVAMLASCVAFPALAVLLLQLQVVLHMVHEPNVVLENL